MHYLPPKWPRTILAGFVALVGGWVAPAIAAVDARLSTDGGNLHGDESRVAAVGEFAVSGGQLSEIGSVAPPSGATPAGVAVN